MKTIIYKLKEYFFPFIIISFTICLILFPTSNIKAARQGIDLFITGILPSLFPFFIAADLLSYTKIIQIMSQKLNKYMHPLFNVPGIGAFPLIMGIISGYPTGAKIVTDLRNKDLLTQEEGERLLSFTNNSGPMFIIGTIGTCFFKNKNIGTLLLLTHILGTLTIGFIFRFWKTNKKREAKLDNPTYIDFKNIGEILGNSIKNSLITICTIGGFITLFSIIISILFQSNILKLLPNNWLQGIIIGIIELTNGISFLTSFTNDITTIILLTSFLIGLGGLSVLLQVLSITSKSDLSIKPYIIGKLLHGIISAFYTYIILLFFPIT